MHKTTCFSSVEIDGLLITFDNQRKTNYYLMTTGQKHQLMSNYGVDYLIVFPYELIKNISYVDFIKMLESFNVKNIICGDDFTYLLSNYNYINSNDLEGLEDYLFKGMIYDI